MREAEVAKLAAEVRAIIDASPYDAKLHKKISNRLRNEFLARRGWRLARSNAWPPLGVLGLSNLLDHQEAARDLKRRLIIISQPYEQGPRDGTEEENAEFAALYGLKVEHVKDFPSWYYPGRTRLVLWWRG